MRILITGIAGFIGYHLAKRLVQNNVEIIGIDNINSYYNQKLKIDRLKNLNIPVEKIQDNNITENEKIIFIKADITNQSKVENIYKTFQIDKVIHLAAQVGVRYSIQNPAVYINSNIVGFFNMLEYAIKHNINHFIFASSSSVYGNRQGALSENMCINSPVSLYAATKIADEMIAKSYSKLYDLNITGLRFFTVYGEWGRPDMSYYIFTQNIIKNQPITLFNYGHHKRDFTYITDIINGLEKIIYSPPKSKFEILNIGSGKAVELIEVVRTLETLLNKKAKIVLYPKQKGDVDNTLADITKLKTLYNYTPKYDLKTGLKNFINWFLNYHKIKL